MEIIMCALIFAMGTVFGSFFTLAVYRIPLKKDITHERSFCPNCNHKLGFLDLIPILSYIFLKGKCRYCGKKIRIRYLLLEMLSGVIFLVAYLSMNFNYPYLEVKKLIYLLAFILFYVTIVLISGIDKEYITINKSVVIFGVITQGIYALYLNFYQSIPLLKYSVYLIFIILIFLFDTLLHKKENTRNYIIELIYLSLYINMFIEPILFILIILFTILFGIWTKVVKAFRKNVNLQSIENEEMKNTRLPIGFFMGISTIGIVLVQNFTCYWG